MQWGTMRKTDRNGWGNRAGVDDVEEEEEAITDYYAVLGVSDDATAAQIKKAYRRLARKYHPDKNIHNVAQSKRIFQHITEAHDILSDPVKRLEYDREWGPDVAWCPGGYTRQPPKNSENDKSYGSAAYSRASTAETRRSTMASAFARSFDSEDGNDFEKAANAWDSMMEQLLKPIRERGAIRFQKLFRGYLARKGLGPKFKAFLRRSSRRQRAGCDKLKEGGIPDRVEPTSKNKVLPRKRPQRPLPAKEAKASPRPKFRLRAKTAPALPKKNTRPPKKPPPVPRRSRKQEKGEGEGMRMASEKEKRGGISAAASKPSSMKVAIDRASKATKIQRAVRAALARDHTICSADQNSKKKHQAAVCIQALSRGSRVRAGLARAYLRAAAAARKKFMIKLHKRVTSFQTQFRRASARQKANFRRQAAKTLTRWARRRLHEHATKHALEILTSWMRQRLAILRSKNLARASAASIKIQSLARARLGRRAALTRKRVILIKRELKRRQLQHRSANTLQNFLRVSYPRHKAKLKRMQQRALRATAAALIQRNMRSFMSHRQAKRLMAKKQIKADTKFILSVGMEIFLWSKRCEEAKLKRQEEASVILQRVWRGYMGKRYVYSMTLELSSRKREAAAAILQAAIREFLVRKKTQRNCDTARKYAYATRLQAIFRGMGVRYAMSQNHASAVILQCYIRQHLARVRVRTALTLRWFNRRDRAAFVLQRYMRAWKKQKDLEMKYQKYLDESLRKIQHWIIECVHRKRIASGLLKAQTRKWQAALITGLAAKRFLSNLKNGRAIRWQSLHGGVRMSSGYMKQRKFVSRHLVQSSEDDETRMNVHTRCTSNVPKQMRTAKSPNLARRVLRSSHLARSKHGVRRSDQLWNNILPDICANKGAESVNSVTIQRQAFPQLHISGNGRSRVLDMVVGRNMIGGC